MLQCRKFELCEAQELGISEIPKVCFQKKHSRVSLQCFSSLLLGSVD